MLVPPLPQPHWARGMPPCNAGPPYTAGMLPFSPCDSQWTVIQVRVVKAEIASDRPTELSFWHCRKESPRNVPGNFFWNIQKLSPRLCHGCFFGLNQSYPTGRPTDFFFGLHPNAFSLAILWTWARFWKLPRVWGPRRSSWHLHRDRCPRDQRPPGSWPPGSASAVPHGLPGTWPGSCRRGG